jgi:hypothetical protein
MIRTLPLAVLAAAALGATAPAAAQTGTYYAASFATAPSDAKFVTRSTIWTCTGTTCTAPKAGSRDAIMCELVARQGGALTAFTAGGNAFDAEALSKCNSRAK